MNCKIEEEEKRLIKTSIRLSICYVFTPFGWIQLSKETRDS